MRDYRKLQMFEKADAAVVKVYRATANFPNEERYGLQAQIRKAAVSCPTNLVEGCTRRTTAEYLHFANIAAGSAAEVRYLVDLAMRLGFVFGEDGQAVITQYSEVVAGLQRLINSLSNAP